MGERRVRMAVDKERRQEEARDEALRRLATYGSLGPDRENAHHLAELGGRWLHGTVRGRLVEQGWGAAMGYPGIVLDEAGDEVQVHVFESDDLPAHWMRLDELEGPGYRRSVVSVATSEGALQACIYELAPRAS